MLKFDGFDGAVIGVANVWQGSRRYDTLVYSGQRIIDTLVRESGLSIDEAHEHFSFNIDCAYVGEQTPIVVWEQTMTDVEVNADDYT